MNVSYVEVLFCAQCVWPAVPDPRNFSCTACGNATERRFPFCNNPNCRGPVLIDTNGNCLTCGRPVEYRAVTDRSGFWPHDPMRLPPTAATNNHQPPREKTCQALPTAPPVAAMSA